VSSTGWSNDEKEFVKDYADKGINWLCSHMSRSKAGIQRMAFINGIPIKNMRNEGKEKAPRKPYTRTISTDDQAQESVKALQSVPWPIP